MGDAHQIVEAFSLKGEFPCPFIDKLIFEIKLFGLQITGQVVITDNFVGIRMVEIVDIGHLDAIGTSAEAYPAAYAQFSPRTQRIVLGSVVDDFRAVGVCVRRMPPCITTHQL